MYIFLLVLISTFFARFALRPLREALNLNDEFVKDMLHDFNTPLSSLKINFKILQKKFGKDEAISRSEEAMQTINNLQSNLSYFLAHSLLSKEKLDLKLCLETRIKSCEVIFSDISFSLNMEKVYLELNPDSFVRIVDNILSNAAKYNVAKGRVMVSFEKKHLIIEDSGIGIKNPSKVFNRFYKETSRGMGIGLHVVKKLCDDLNIEIKIESELKKGTKFSLNLEKVMFS
jgi:signal transduction histidine kinase